MSNLILYTDSLSFFTEVQAYIGALDQVLCEPVHVEMEHNVKWGIAFKSEGGRHQTVRYHLSAPVRLGEVFDLIQRALADSTHAWRNVQQTDLGIYVLYPREMMLRAKNMGEDVSLTEKERDMLMCLYGQPEHSIEKDALLEFVWGYGQNIETHTLETHIYRLRQKVEKDPSSPKWLVTTETGYKLCVS